MRASKKIVSSVLAVCMLASSSALTAFAATDNGSVGATVDRNVAAMEALYDGGEGVGLTIVPKIEVPYALSIMATNDPSGYVPGISAHAWEGIKNTDE